MFAEECIFQVVPSTVTLLPKSTYKVVIQFGINAQQLQPHACFLDTGAGLNLINKTSLKREWLSNVKKQQLPRLRTETKEPILLDGTILLFIKIDELRVRVWFGIVQNLAVDILLGTSFIDRYIRGIFPTERKVLPWHSSPVQILSRNNLAAVQLHLSEQNWTGIPVTTIRVARQTVVPPQSQSCVPVHSSTSGRFRLEPTSLGPDFLMHHVAPGIIEPAETKVFLVLICDFSTTPRRLPKHMMLATGVNPPPFVINVGDSGNNSTALLSGADSTVAAVHFKPKENRTKQVERRERVQSSQSNNTKADCKVEGNLSDNYSQYRQEFIQMLEPFSDMWDGHLWSISVAKHRIDQMPQSNPVHSALY